MTTLKQNYHETKLLKQAQQTYVLIEQIKSVMIYSTYIRRTGILRDGIKFTALGGSHLFTNISSNLFQNTFTAFGRAGGSGRT